MFETTETFFPLIGFWFLLNRPLFLKWASYLKLNWHGFGTYPEKFPVYWSNAKKMIGGNESFVKISSNKLRLVRDVTPWSHRSAMSRRWHHNVLRQNGASQWGRSSSIEIHRFSASANSGVLNLVCCGQAWPNDPHFWPIGWLGCGSVSPTLNQSQQINITFVSISRNVRYLDTSAFGIWLFVFILIDCHQKNGVLENRVSSPLKNSSF